MAFPQYFFLCTQKNFRWLYAVGFAPSLKHWWFYQSNPVLLYGLSRTGRIARWTSSQGPVIETSQLFQCIFEIKTNVRPHYHPITSRYRHDAIKNWLDFSPFLLFFLFNNLSFILSTLKKKQSMWLHFYIHEPMCRGCIELSKGVFLLEFVKYFRCLWKTTMNCGLFTEHNVIMVLQNLFHFCQYFLKCCFPDNGWPCLHSKFSYLKQFFRKCLIELFIYLIRKYFCIIENFELFSF